jgi:hypothetical protein
MLVQIRFTNGSRSAEISIRNGSPLKDAIDILRERRHTEISEKDTITSADGTVLNVDAPLSNISQLIWNNYLPVPGKLISDENDIAVPVPVNWKADWKNIADMKQALSERRIAHQNLLRHWVNFILAQDPQKRLRLGVAT